jgi:hypothetical protein
MPKKQNKKDARPWAHPGLPIPDVQPLVLSTSEAAALLRLQPQTLRVWRSRGGGPAFVSLGTGTHSNRIRYTRASLEAFISQRQFGSTGDAAKKTRHSAGGGR